MKPITSIIIAFIAIMMVGCSNSKMTQSEVDDIYFTAKDRSQGVLTSSERVAEVNGEDFADSEENSYFYKGSAIESNDANPNSAGAYARAQQQTEFSDADVVNNFYGNTTYIDGDYYDESYASRLRRFDSDVYVGAGYYDPYYTNPCWNYGWSSCNAGPAQGWNVGYNTWSGWNVGYTMTWGNVGCGPCGNAGFYDPWMRGCGGGFGYYDPWMTGCGGGFGYYDPWMRPAYGWGYGSPNYWRGYNHGYWNGWNDGRFYGGGMSPQQRRPVYNGRRDLANEEGFPGQYPNRRSPSAGGGSQKTASNSVAITDERVNDSRSRLERSTGVYQPSSAARRSRPGNNQVTNESTSNINPNAQSSSNRYQRPSQPQAESRSKYSSSNLVGNEAGRRIDRSQATRPTSTRPNSVQSSGARPSSSQPSTEQRATSRSRSVSTPSRNSTQPRTINNQREIRNQEYYRPSTSRSSTRQSQSPATRRQNINNGGTRTRTSTPPRTNRSPSSTRPSSQPRSVSPPQSSPRGSSRSYSSPRSSPRSSSPSMQSSPSRGSSSSRSSAPSGRRR